MLLKIDRYILRNFLLTFVLLLLVFSAIAIVFDYTEKMKDFVTRKPPAWDVFTYFANFLPYILALLFPIFIFVAVILFTSILANRSEIIAILNTGMTFNRFLRPYFLGAGIICIVLLVANHYVIPLANKKRLQFEQQYIWEHTYVKSHDDNIHLRVSPTEYVYMQSYNPDAKTGFRFSYEVIEGTLLKEKWIADQCKYDTVKKLWKLNDVVVRKNDSLREHVEVYKELNKKFSFTSEEIIPRRGEIKQMMTSPQLNEYIQREELKGSEGLSEYYIEKYRRTSTPFSAFVLSIIGACLASRKVRGGSGVHVALGLMISAIYIFTMQFSTTFALKGNLHPMLAVWIPNVLFGIIAYFIYRRRLSY
jgi:lipopolysaccharide export system permease protein